MNLKELIKPYKKKLALDAFVRAITLGAVLGLASALIYSVVLGIAAVICRSAANNGWGLADNFSKEFVRILEDNWQPVAIIAGISLAIGLLVTVAITIASYIDIYKKGVKRAISTIDSLGLEERVITMVEYQQDPSYVAKLQREDAKKRLEEFDTKNIVVKPPKKKLISILSLFLAFTMLLSVVAGAFHLPGQDQWRKDVLAEWESIKTGLFQSAEGLPEKEYNAVADIIESLDKDIKDIIYDKDLNRDQVNQMVQDRLDIAIGEIDKIILETEDEELKDKLEDIKEDLENAKDEMDSAIENTKDPAQRDKELFEKIEKVINDAQDVPDDKKATVRAEIAALKVKFENISVDETLSALDRETAKKDAALATVKVLEKMVSDEQAQIKAIVNALKENIITNELGVAIGRLNKAIEEALGEKEINTAKENLKEAIDSLEYMIQKGSEATFDMSKDLAGYEDLFKDENGEWLTGEPLVLKIYTEKERVNGYVNLTDGEYKKAYEQLYLDFALAEKEAEKGNSGAAKDMIIAALEAARQKKSFDVDELKNAISGALAKAKAVLEERNGAPSTYVGGFEKVMNGFVTELDALKVVIGTINIEPDVKAAKIEGVFEQTNEKIVESLMQVTPFAVMIDGIIEAFEDRFNTEMSDDSKITLDKIDEIMQKIQEHIANSKVTSDTKAELKLEMESVGQALKNILGNANLTIEERETAIKNKVNQTLENLDIKVEQEKTNAISIIEALKQNDITKELGEALDKLQKASETGSVSKIAEAETAVRTAMNGLKSTANSATKISAIVSAIKAAIASTKPVGTDLSVASSALEKSLNNFCSNLEEVKGKVIAGASDLATFTDKKFQESAEEIIEAAKNATSLKELAELIEKEFDELIKEETETGKVDDEILEDTMDKIEEDIEDAEITEDKKEDLKEEMDKLEEDLKDIINDDKLSPDQKDEAIKDKIDETIKDLEEEAEKEKENMISLIEALKKNEITKELGVAMEKLQIATQEKDSSKIKEGEKAIETAMNNLSDAIMIANPPITKIIEAINSAIASTKPEGADSTVAISELEKAMVKFVANLEAIKTEMDNTINYDELNTFIDEKFEESTEDIIEAIKGTENLKDLIDEIEKEFEDMLDEEIETPNDPEKEEDQDKEQTDQDKVDDAFDKIEDDIENSEMTDKDKEDLKDEMDDLKDKLEDILNKDEELADKIEDILKDENKTDEEKKEEIDKIIDENDKGLTEDEKEQIKEDIDDIIDNMPNLKEEIDKIVDENEELKDKVDDTLEESEDLKDKIEDTMDDASDLKDKIDEILKDENKTDDEKKEEIKNEIDKNENLSDENKEDLKDKVDEIVDDQNKTDEEKSDDLKDAVDETTKEEIKDNIDKNENLSDENKEDLKDKVEDSMQDSSDLKDKIDEILKDENKTDDEKKEEIKNEIDKNENMSDENKEDLKDKVDEIVGDQNKTDEEKSDEMEDAVDDATKEEIKDKVDETTKEEIKDNIDKNENMSDENKEDLKQDVDDTMQDSSDLKDKIDDILKDENKTDDEKKEDSSSDSRGKYFGRTFLNSAISFSDRSRVIRTPSSQLLI